MSYFSLLLVVLFEIVHKLLGTPSSMMREKKNGLNSALHLYGTRSEMNLSKINLDLVEWNEFALFQSMMKGHR